MNKFALISFVGILSSIALFIVFELFKLTGISFFDDRYLLVSSLIFGIIFIYKLVTIPNKKNHEINYNAPENNLLTVVLTAYNDELSIKQSVEDFLNHPLVKRVVVISNNSSDNTLKYAIQAGAIAYNETKQGYGACVHRALSEGIKFDDTKLTLLCEGDMTFRAYDIEKFLAYIPHADIVNGTRIVEQLRSAHTQLSSFMFYGNFFVGKLLEIKHLSLGTFTDVGTTYKLCKNSALKELLPQLSNNVNLEFNPYFMDTALQNNIKLVECPITFHPRVGESKGGNINNWVAFKLGFRMMKGIIFKWNT